MLMLSVCVPPLLRNAPSQRPWALAFVFLSGQGQHVARKAWPRSSPSFAALRSGASFFIDGAAAVVFTAAADTVFFSLVRVLGIMHATKLGSIGWRTMS